MSSQFSEHEAAHTSSVSCPFTALGVSAPVVKAIKAMGYEAPTPVQSESIPHVLEGRNVLSQAQTGTGKTGAFALPLLTSLDSSARLPQLLILSPTRELASQIAEAFESYSQHLPSVKIASIYGGQSFSNQRALLRRGAQVVVGTPGRIMDHLRRGTLVLDDLQALVLDEADEMLRMGFIEDVEWILEHTPAEKQTLLFSATMPRAIKRVAQRYLDDAVEISIDSQTRCAGAIEQCYWFVSGTNKLDALDRLLEVENTDASIIFAKTKRTVSELTEKLLKRGYSCAELSGDLAQSAREQTVQRLKDGTIDVVVATDVAARGIDVPRITHVFNYDPPHDTESYVHRIGRTGRAGRAGKAILFVSPRERFLLRKIEKLTGQRITELDLPDRGSLREVRLGRFKAEVLKGLEASIDPAYLDVLAEISENTEASVEQLLTSLCALLKGEGPVVSIPEPRKRESRGEKRGGRSERRRDRGDRRDRGERGGKGRRGERRGDRRDRNRDERRGESRGRKMTPLESGMIRCRIEVGINDGVRPGGIVAAIAEQGGIRGRAIGRITLHDRHTVVDLPETISKAALRHLGKAYVSNRPMKLSVMR